MIKYFKQLHLSQRFFILFGGITALFCLAFPFPVLFPIAKALLIIASGITITDILLLFGSATAVKARRSTPKLFSLGSDNPVKLEIENASSLLLTIMVIDELPEQFQLRNFIMTTKLEAQKKKLLEYTLTPRLRGEYYFGNINLIFTSVIGLTERRIIQEQSAMVPVYPSIVQMKKFELMSVNSISYAQGIKKMRRLGHSYEFEQIKAYVVGDDYRSLNWKATGRKGELMVNQFVDEKSQQIYSLIDNSRAMRMPFGGLSLLDHAVNTSLVISNIALNKQDKAGLLIFSDKPQSILKAENGRGQLKKILEVLYKIQDKQLEADYELLYLTVRNNIKGRSLLLLYTNFESKYALERVIPILRKLNKLHLLVIVFFENTEITEFSKQEANNIEGIYTQTIAQLFVSEKKQMVQMLQQYGIQAVLSNPEDLAVNTINKYLELKARGMI